MKFKMILMISLAAVALVRADDTIAQAQQALKDQGFYYGEITGQKNAETMAAIRRYQIRNGLQVTGELDNDTSRSLATPPSEPAVPAVRSSPPARPNTSERDDEPTRETGSEPDTGLQPFANGPGNGGDVRGQDRFENAPTGPPIYPSGPATVVPSGGGLFAGTPYATAPPEVQRDLIASAQRILERRDLYHGDVDGVFGPNMEFSLRAYQSRVGLPVTGRLDLETLAGLNLLSGAHMPAFVPHRQIVRPRFEQPVRGEWIRE
jgi:peptidoglycan hydrolase-like protein with peptidoglycan-binding domain